MEQNRITQKHTMTQVQVGMESWFMDAFYGTEKHTVDQQTLLRDVTQLVAIRKRILKQMNEVPGDQESF